jgi:hypothetical protein
MKNYDRILSLFDVKLRAKIAKAGKRGPALLIRTAISSGFIRTAADLIDVQTAATPGNCEADRGVAAVATLQHTASYSTTPTEMAMEFAQKYGVRDPRPGVEVAISTFNVLSGACADFMQVRGQEALNEAAMLMTRAQMLLRKSRA